VGRRIAVIGGSCAGKTTLAARLADRLGIPHIELDSLHHHPNWVESTAAELQRDVEAALEPLEGWVVDGNYMRKIGTLVIDRADTVVWLDLPLGVCLRRMWSRSTTRIRDGTDLWGTGNRETWPNFLFKPNALLPYEVRTRRRRRRECSVLAPGRLVRLRTPADVEAWFEAQH
jgi:adenylate kinase family enzyme